MQTSQRVQPLGANAHAENADGYQDEEDQCRRAAPQNFGALLILLDQLRRPCRRLAGAEHVGVLVVHVAPKTGSWLLLDQHLRARQVRRWATANSPAWPLASP